MALKWNDPLPHCFGSNVTLSDFFIGVTRALGDEGGDGWKTFTPETLTKELESLFKIEIKPDQKKNAICDILRLQWSGYFQEAIEKHNEEHGQDEYIIEEKICGFCNIAPDCPKNKENALNSSKKENNKPLFKMIIEIAKENATFFHDQLNDPYAILNFDDHREIHPLKSKNFKRWTSKLVWESGEKAINGEIYREALNVLESYACFGNNQISLSNRVAYHDDAIYYDLSDQLWRAVKIDKDGWTLLNKPPILFRRYKHQKPQVEPEKNANFDKIFEYVNIKDSDDQLLFKCQIASYLVPDCPHTIICVYGDQGSSKSTLTKIVKSLVDPSEINGLSLPRTNEMLIQTLAHHYFAPFDNVTEIKDWVSDTLCRAVTGEGHSKRELYTDDEDIIYSFRSCIGINGINTALVKPDALDRAITYRLSRLEKFKNEREFWGDFKKDKPAILGGMFNVLSKAMKIKENWTYKIPEGIRMADFCEWGEAIAQALGRREYVFTNTYLKKINEENLITIEGHPVGGAILELMVENDRWEGTPTELLDELNTIADDLKIDGTMKNWPKAPNALTRKINEIKTNLRESGIIVDYTPGKKRRVIISKYMQNIVNTVVPSPDNDNINKISSPISSQTQIPSFSQNIVANTVIKKPSSDGKQ